MLEDLRFALKSLGRSKATTTVLLVSLALGTGANAAVCGIVYALLLQAPAGVGHADDLSFVYTSEFSGSAYGRSSYPDFLSLSNAGVAEGLAAYDDEATQNVRLGSSVRAARVASVTDGFFSVLTMEAKAGRLLHASDTQRTPPAAVLSVTLADFLDDARTITGKQIRIGERLYEVVGVTPTGFRGLTASRTTDVWVLMSADGRHDRGDRRLSIVARHDGGLQDLNQTLDTLSRSLATEYPTTNRGALNAPDLPRRFSAHGYSPAGPNAGSGFALIAIVVAAAMVLLLASACVNAGSLLLSRAMARRHELAVKRALGATRVRLIRQLFAESVFVCLGGGALGLLMALWIVEAIPALFSPDHAELLHTSGMPMLMLLTLGISALAGIAFGVAPALQGTDAPESLVLRSDAGGISGGSRSTRTRSALLVAQLALSTLLLIVTATLVRGLNTALDADFGVAAHNVAIVSLKYDITCAGHRDDRAKRIEALPGVERVGWATLPPLGRATARPYAVQAGLRTFDRVDFPVSVVTPAYFEAANLALISGRVFTTADRTRTEPVAVVDELLAHRYFGTSAVGQHLIDVDRDERIRIVGVVRSGRYRTLQDTPQPTVYRPLMQQFQTCGFMFIRTAGDPAATLPSVIRHLQRTEPSRAVIVGKTMTQHLSDALLIDRITTTMVGLCGLIALVMGAIGVYGAMSDAVRRRTREIGLRLALGAGRLQVVRLILAEALLITAGGVAIGLVCAVGAEFLAGTAVHGLPKSDLSLLVQTPLLLAIAVALASVVPLRRALSVNPATALGLRT